MHEYRLDFEHPAWLALLVILPAIWVLSFRSLSALGGVRRIVAILLRTAVLALIIAALAEVQLVRTSDRLTVIYLLDRSLSISPESEQLALNYVNAAIAEHRSKHPDDEAGLIVFGRDAAMELPPLDEQQQAPVVESIVDREYTNLTAGLKLAQASFPHDTAKRVVIVTDGNENLGDALSQAQRMMDDGIGVDVVPIRSRSGGEVAVEKVAIPTDVRRGQPFDVRVVLNNMGEPGAKREAVKGRLRITRRAGPNETVLADNPITLEPGKRVLRIREQIDMPEFYSYDAQFVPDRPVDDTMPQNNRATTFAHVRGTGQVLLIEDFESRGEYNFLAERLRAANLEVQIRPSGPNPPFADLSELQPFDTVLLANVPREHFSDEQIEMLVRNTQNLGAGLVMLGGSNSFGAGGWTSTPMEAAMPLDFQIKSAKVAPVGALAMLMHASEMAEGNYWQKVIGQEAIKALGGHDYCGVLHWDGNDQWLWDNTGTGMVRVGPNRRKMLAIIDRMNPGDMPDFTGTMKKALTSLKGLNAAVKHMIIISDGDPGGPPKSLLQQFVAANIKVTTVGVGTHGPPTARNLQNIATATGGKFYNVTNPKMLPKIYQKEARRVSRPLVYERAEGFRPVVKFPHEMLQGISQQLPPITGYVLTTVKQNPLVEVSVLSPQPAGQANNAILASWTYGLGKTVAFTTDAGKRWAADWPTWENYDKFFGQMVRWSMRPVQDMGKFTVSTDFEDGKIKVVVTALDKNDEFMNFLNLGGTVVGPSMKPTSLQVEQTAPGRYVGEMEATEKGNYFVLLTPGPGRSPIRVGVNVPYSDEFRQRQTNEGLLRAVAALSPRDGHPGKVIEAPGSARGSAIVPALLQTNTFRHDLRAAVSSQDVWHLLVLAASCILFADVFVRRVSVDVTWIGPLAVRAWHRLRGHAAPVAQEVTIDRLRSRKAEVTEQLEQRKAALRFEPTSDLPPSASPLEGEIRPVDRPPTPKEAKELTPEAEGDSYTSRLLKAKQRVWDERKDQQ